MDARVRIGAVALLALAPVGCVEIVAAAHQSTFLKTPKLSPLTADEQTMDCAQLDLALDRAETVRWLIRENGGRLGFWADTHGLLNAADGRIRELLQHKRSRDCQPRATAIADMDDAALLSALESIQVKLDAGGDEAVQLDERTRLLDNLRVVPAPSAGKAPR